MIDTDNGWRFCVAPMLDLTTPACRVLHRALLPQARLYSEMISTGAIIFGDRARYLRHGDDHPCALQLGGGDPDALARATAIAQAYHYAEINLNVGCPSDRVQNNRIGACLMTDPALVATCLRRMQRESVVPVTIKHRLGIDDQDERKVLDFIDQIVNESDCRVFIVHARKAWLQGLSPKANRDIPPLNYDLVYEIKQRFPTCTIVLNGGITTIAECRHHLQYVDGVMLGRAAYQRPELLVHAATLFSAPVRTQRDMIADLSQIIETALANGAELSEYTRHLLGLFAGQPGAKQYRRILSEQARGKTDIAVWEQALAAVRK